MTTYNTWTMNSDGSVDFNGTVHFPAGTNLASGAGVVVFGPGGGMAGFPAIEQGIPGLSPTLNFSVVQVPTGTSLPATNPAVTLVSPGTPGVASIYDVVIYVNEGADGADGPNSVIQANDVEGTPVDKQILVYVTADSKVQWQTPKVGGLNSITTISSTASGTTAQRSLTSITIPAQPWAWWPTVFAQSVITNAVDTRVDLVAYKGNVSDGVIVGRALGAGAGAGPTTSVLIPAFGSDLPGGSGYGTVAANATVVISLRAENQVSSSNPWATGASTFTVKVDPIP